MNDLQSILGITNKGTPECIPFFQEFIIIDPVFLDVMNNLKYQSTTKL